MQAKLCMPFWYVACTIGVACLGSASAESGVTAPAGANGGAAITSDPVLMTLDSTLESDHLAGPADVTALDAEPVSDNGQARTGMKFEGGPDWAAADIAASLRLACPYDWITGLAHEYPGANAEVHATTT